MQLARFGAALGVQLGTVIRIEANEFLVAGAMFGLGGGLCGAIGGGAQGGERPAHSDDALKTIEGRVADRVGVGAIVLVGGTVVVVRVAGVAVGGEDAHELGVEDGGHFVDGVAAGVAGDCHGFLDGDEGTEPGGVAVEGGTADAVGAAVIGAIDVGETGRVAFNDGAVETAAVGRGEALED